MTEYFLHTLVLIGDTLQTHRTRAIRQLNAQGTLQGGTPVIQPVGVEPGEQVFTGLYRGSRAEKMMEQLRQLAESGPIEEVALFGRDSSTSDDGYYTTSNIQPRQVRPATRELWRYDLTLRRKGTRKTHWRAVKTTPTQPENGTDFGNDTTGYIGAPSAASRVRWFEPATEDREDPTLVATRNGRFGDVDVYDAKASSFDQPVLIYDLAYSEEGKTDCRVYDDLSNASRLDSDSNLQWQRVYDAGHDVSGTAYVENGLRRMQFDEDNQTLNAWDWNDGTSSWDSVSLGTSDWEFYDLDLNHIGLSTVRAQVEFRDPTTSPDSFYSLDCVLERGQTDASWFVPQNEGDSTPAGLQTLLNPISDSTVVDPQAQKTVVERADVRL